METILTDERLKHKIITISSSARPKALKLQLSSENSVTDSNFTEQEFSG